MPVLTCDERKTPLRVYPYRRPTGIGEKQTPEMWTLAVCASCGANEVLPILYDKDTVISRRFPRDLWNRFHGFTRRFTVTDTKGKSHEELEIVPSSWSDHPCLTALELKDTIADQAGKLIAEAFTVQKREED